MLRLDVDAHRGQQDVWEAHSLLSRYFDGAYNEPSTNHRGWAFRVLVHAAFVARDRFNSFIEQEFVPAVRKLFSLAGVTCTFEVGGLFTTKRSHTNYQTGEVLVTAARGRFGCVPLCPNEGDVRRLTHAPIFTVAHLNRVVADAEMHRLIETEMLVDQEAESDPEVLSGRAPRRANKRTNPAIENYDAFWRMNIVAFDFTLEHNRLPEMDELLDAYRERHDGEDHEGRIRRAGATLKLRGGRFGPGKFGGFAHWRDRLVAAVGQHCRDRSTKYKAKIDDTDLAVALFVVQSASFKRHPNPVHQFTVAGEAITSAFGRIAAEGHIPHHRRCNLNKVGALKAILERARLITCLDPDVIVSRDGTGVAQKWVLGPRHWLHGAFAEFSTAVQWVSVQKLRKLAKDRKAIRDWINAPSPPPELMLEQSADGHP